jgi:N-acetyl-gamma-glutamyl-phosphate reductase
MTIHAGILGATGYAGAGLIERLLRHPEVELVALGSRRWVGRDTSEAWPQLAGLTDLTFTDNNAVIDKSDVVFCATPHRDTAALVAQARSAGKRVIDLSADFRLEPKTYTRWYGIEHPHPELYPEACYGLVELYREHLHNANIISTPGCNATTVILALAPIAAEGLLGKDIVANVITGASGAGRGVSDNLHFSQLNETSQPYKVAGQHRHLAEIEMSLEHAANRGKVLTAQGGAPPPVVTFTPHLVPMTRGILATCVTYPDQDSLDDPTLFALYQDYYEGDPLIHIQTELPTTKAVTGSDRVLISVHKDPRSQAILTFAAIDNLGKGAAGQAVQGFNVAFGFSETLGLSLVGDWP